MNSLNYSQVTNQFENLILNTSKKKLIETIDESFLPSCSFTLDMILPKQRHNFTNIQMIKNKSNNNYKQSLTMLNQNFFDYFKHSSSIITLSSLVLPFSLINIKSMFKKKKKLIFSIKSFLIRNSNNNKFYKLAYFINFNQKLRWLNEYFFASYFFQMKNLIKQNGFLLRSLLLIFLLNILTSNFIKTRTMASNLPSARFNDDERKLVRNLFLKKFGLQSLAKAIEQDEHLLITPNNYKNQMPRYIWKLYEQANYEDYDIIRHYSPISSNKIIKNNILFYLKAKTIISLNLAFNLSDAVDRNANEENVLRADLRISLKNIFKLKNKKLPENILKSINNIGIIKIYGYNIKNNQTRTEIIETKSIEYNSKWVDFNVYKYVIEKQNQTDMISFFIELVFDLHLNQISFNNKSDKPLGALMIFINNVNIENKNYINQKSKKIRRKRNINKKRKHRKYSTLIENNECRRTELYVDFNELNWQDWLMAPVGYKAYQCHGKCSFPMPSYLNTTNHAIIQSLINSIDPNAVPQPSCVPVEMSSISILYRDVNNVIVVKTYPDMKVESCGCY